MKNDKEVHLLILVRVEEKRAQGDVIRSKSANQSYRDNFDACFGKKQESSALN
jgi:hypothetical protein